MRRIYETSETDTFGNTTYYVWSSEQTTPLRVTTEDKNGNVIYDYDGEQGQGAQRPVVPKRINYHD